MKLNRKELAHILAGLRALQTRTKSPQDVADIIIDGGGLLTDAEIDDLCMRINTETVVD